MLAHSKGKRNMTTYPMDYRSSTFAEIGAYDRSSIDTLLRYE